jgi:hypothetical protein
LMVPSEMASSYDLPVRLSVTESVSLGTSDVLDHVEGGWPGKGEPSRILPRHCGRPKPSLPAPRGAGYVLPPMTRPHTPTRVSRARGALLGLSAGGTGTARAGDDSGRGTATSRARSRPRGRPLDTRARDRERPARRRRRWRSANCATGVRRCHPASPAAPPDSPCMSCPWHSSPPTRPRTCSAAPGTLPRSRIPPPRRRGRPWRSTWRSRACCKDIVTSSRT